MTLSKIKILTICLLGAVLVGSAYANSASVCPAPSALHFDKATGTFSAAGGWVSNGGQVNVKMPLRFLSATITQAPNVPHNAPQSAVACEYGNANDTNKYAQFYVTSPDIDFAKPLTNAWGPKQVWAYSCTGTSNRDCPFEILVG